LRFDTSKFGDEQNNLKDYVDRMMERQNDISYITGESIAVGSSFLFLGYMLKAGSLRYLTWWTPVDEYAAQQLKEFDGKKLKSTAKEGFDLEDEDEKTKAS